MEEFTLSQISHMTTQIFNIWTNSPYSNMSYDYPNLQQDYQSTANFNVKDHYRIILEK